MSHYNWIRMQIYFEKFRDSIVTLRARGRTSHKMILLVVFWTNMLDNLLLTSIVPIIPSFLLSQDINELKKSGSLRNSTETHTTLSPTPTFHPDMAIADPQFRYYYHHHHLYSRAFPRRTGPFLPPHRYHGNDGKVNDSSHTGYSLSAMALSENTRVGWLLSSKALVQIIANPFIGPLCNRLGYTLLLFGGSIVIMFSAIVFSFAESYAPLFLARATQGLGSAATVIAGMSIVARHYPDDRGRSRAMGIAMGGGALGVLVGYPFGGIVYTFVGKTCVFLLIGFLFLLDIGLQWFLLDVAVTRESQIQITPLCVLLKDPYILIASGTVMMSSMSMSVLESTVPLWVMSFMKASKWELGLMFLPDSIGYLVGTNCFGLVARSIGRWICAVACMMLISLCLVCLPFANTVPQLILPHFGLGLGLGIIDAAIMPLLALLVDLRHESFYGCVYAIAQLAVCLAYFVGPSFAGLIVKCVGFSWLMRGMAIFNALYIPLCIVLKRAPNAQEEDIHLTKRPSSKDREAVADEASFGYGRLHEDED